MRRPMGTYTVTGARSIAGKRPGQELTDDELVGCNIAALIEGGHLTPNPTKAPKAETNEEK
jgi:hypothetical protein